MKKVLILSASPRKGGNSDLLSDEFARGATDSGHEVEKIRVAEKKIDFCRACAACRAVQMSGPCVIKDDMADILEKMLASDVIVLASPVYFYSIDAQLKVLIDRTFSRAREIKNKEIYYIISAADEPLAAADTAVACLRGYTACLNGSREMGIIYGMGVYEKGGIKGTPTMSEAYEMGKRV